MAWGDSVRNFVSAPIRGIGGAIGSAWSSAGNALQDRTWGVPNAQPQRPDLRPPSLGSYGGPGSYGNYGQAFNAALGMSHAQMAPIRSGLSSAYQQMQHQAGLTGQQFDLQGRGLNANYGFDVRSLGLKDEALGVERGGIQRRGGLLEGQLQMANQLRQMLDPEYYARHAEIGRGVENERFRNRAQTRSRGAMGSEGYRFDQNDIIETGNFQMGELYRGFQRDVLGANDRIAQAGESVAANKDALRMLDIQAKQLGVDRDRLASNLELGLQRLGLDRQMSLNELLGRMTSNRVEDQMLGQRIMQAALQATPIYQSANYLPPAVQAALIGRG